MRLWSQPRVSSSAYKFVVVQLGIVAIDAINLLLLSGAQILLRIQAPNILEQPLSPEHLM